MTMKSHAAKSGTAGEFVPKTHSLARLRRAAAECQGCELFRRATQTVFGEGPASARLMLVGETPGDQEDRMGHPFVGAAGRLLDEVLTEAGIDRKQAYVTNAVKHFKFVERGKRRLHAKPSARDDGLPAMARCRDSGDRAGIDRLFGRDRGPGFAGPRFSHHALRGKILPVGRRSADSGDLSPRGGAPAPDEASRRQMRTDFLSDLRAAGAWVAKS